MPVPARAVKPISDKVMRIETLQPHMVNGQILLHASQSTLEQQFSHIPKADHDDGPDAVQMVWAGALANSAPIEWQSVGDADLGDNEYNSMWSR